MTNGKLRVSEVDKSPEIVYLVTSSVSSRLMRGQHEYLAKSGYRVTVGVGLEDGSGPTGGFDTGVEVIDLGFRRPVALADDVRSLVKTVALLRRRRPAHVNVSTPKAALLGMVAALIARVPHRVYVVRGLRYETMSGKGRRFYQSTERLVMRLAHDVLFNSQSLLDVAVDDGLIDRSHASVLAGGSGNGIDMSRFDVVFGGGRHLADSNAPVLGFVGRLTADKGVADLIELFQAVAAVRARCRLRIVGDFEVDDPVDQKTREFIETDPRVDHVGWTDDVAGQYARMDLLVFLSKREGLPNVPLEAQASGVPVVGFAATGTVDAVLDGRRALAPVGDLATLAIQIDDLLQSPEAYARRSSAVHAFVAENFARERVWEALVEVYESAVR